MCEGAQLCESGACVAVCTPGCTDKVCGDDGCGGSCGACALGEVCDAGACVVPCLPACAGKLCGDDGCGGECGSCGPDALCESGACVVPCAPDCASKTCGDDGCGGSCGACALGEVCASGACLVPCEPACAGLSCGDDGCGGDCGPCPPNQICDAGTCVLPCEPSCSGKSCGDDGCGGSCGACGLDEECLLGACVVPCEPDCVGKSCGDDGCGETCGDCDPGELCTSGACIVPCEPDCNGKVCGDDACGGSCGACGLGEQCESGLCVLPCTPDCDGKACGDDGCAGSCGACDPGQVCEAGACVTPCAPACDGKSCGEDGCGGTCGACGLGEECEAGACVVPCQASCGAAVCGDDGCGGSCGACVPNEVCEAGSCVVPCDPSCIGKTCGDDGCGGSCGACAFGEVCGEGTCSVPCVPACDSASCGDNGCDGTCGTCAPGDVCDGGQCVTPCVPDCAGKSCGDDGCDGTCGECASDEACQSGACVCVPDCDQKGCGGDGCGSTCGECAPGQACQVGVCVDVCQASCDGKACGDDGCGQSCGDCDPAKACVENACVPFAAVCDACSTTAPCAVDLSCRKWSKYPEVTFCAAACQGGVCPPGFACSSASGLCLPDIDTICEAGAIVKTDACGNVLETVETCAPSEQCEGGTCVPKCVPSCGTASCGDDGCGGSCGSCGPAETCAEGACAVPGNVCDACSSAAPCGTALSCREWGAYPGVTFCAEPCQPGTCPGGFACSVSSGFCLPEISEVCANGDVWKQDGCGNLLSEASACSDAEFCEDGACHPKCVPSCDQKACGDDGCGGSCGTCGGGTVCAEGACAVPGDVCGACSLSQPCADGLSCRQYADHDATYCAATCPDGSCDDGYSCQVSGYCAPVVSEVCHEGNVWKQDTCGNMLGVAQTCSDAEYCDAGKCELTCVPDCAGKGCGGDGCGGSCGDCTGETVCAVGQCVAAGEVCAACSAQAPCAAGLSCRKYTSYDVTYCAALCQGGSCAEGYACAPSGFCAPLIGDVCHQGNVWKQDSCGNLLEQTQACNDAEYCDAGKCELKCVPDCADKDCGGDGCGGSCGDCTGETVCAVGQCVVPGEVCAACSAEAPCAAGLSCRKYTSYDVTYCAALCQGGSCAEGYACAPSGFCAPLIGDVCHQGNVWKQDSCGNLLEQTQACNDAEYCDAGKCELKCVPDCADKDCGGDGCGGSCGDCTGETVCAVGQCVVPGEVCAACSAEAPCAAALSCRKYTSYGLTYCAAPCQGGSCAEGHACAPSGFCAPTITNVCHEGDVWKQDSCNNLLEPTENCSDAEYCDAGKCEPKCVPDCTDKSCGGDGCGGSCGACGGGKVCAEGACAVPGDVCAACSLSQPCADGLSCRQYVDHDATYCASTCPDGSCDDGYSCQVSGYCAPVVSEVCHQGNVWKQDSCGNLLEQTQACTDAEYCDTGKCELTCVPDCAEKDCGGDGCGGSCGDCTGGTLCAVGQCVVPGEVCAACSAEAPCAAALSCRKYTSYDVTYCAAPCKGGSCAAGYTCAPSGFCAPTITSVCHQGHVWKQDSCGSLLEQTQACTDAEFCDAGKCELTCVPDCGEKDCGGDGCGGSCGDCTGGTLCAVGQCVVPGEVCAACSAQAPCAVGLSCRKYTNYDVTYCAAPCQAGSCAEGYACAPSGFCAPTITSVCHQGNVWKQDNCGNLLEQTQACSDLEYCDAGTCELKCVPDCADKDCGGDGCGGSCGNCDEATVCAVGQCVVPGAACAACSAAAPCAAGLSCRKYTGYDVTYCAAACPSGSCAEGYECASSGYCAPTITLLCHVGDVWKQDSCGNLLELVETCDATDVCAAGQCVQPGAVCAACSDAAPCDAGLACLQHAGSDVTFCASPCVGGACDDEFECTPAGYCAPVVADVCHDGAIWSQDVCDNLIALVTDCAAGEVCADGKCVVPGAVCDSCSASAPCSAGLSCQKYTSYDVTWCASPCPDGACADGFVCGSAGYCVPIVEAICYQGDAWKQDTCDNLLEELEVCDPDLQYCEDGACLDKCFPDCNGKSCGPDGCDGVCGYCALNEACDAGACVATCTPNCGDQECGSDGCGGSCGACGPIAACQDGSCISTCTPDCDGAECGGDGCGGACGACAPGQICDAGACVTPCVPACSAKECGADGCGGTCGACIGEGETCEGGQCVVPCAPDCAQKECGLDGCGGVCGACATDEHCVEDACTPLCTADCAGKVCGADGCGGICGLCAPGTVCQGGACEAACTADCTGRTCGDDGCCGQCGACAVGAACESGSCVSQCQPSCQGKDCGGDGCGGSCGTCSAPAECKVGWCVAACVTDCAGRDCGPDSCGGLCGTCGLTGLCVGGLCEEQPAGVPSSFAAALSHWPGGTYWYGGCGASSPGATFLSEVRPPLTMTVGETAQVSMTYANCSGVAWGPFDGANGFNLGSQFPPNNTYWNGGRVPLPALVPPQHLVKFDFEITAPSTPGSYGYQWAVVNEYVSWWIPMASPNWTIQVLAACQPSCGGAACGDDGCGGSCGSCGADEACVAGQCAAVAAACETCSSTTPCQDGYACRRAPGDAPPVDGYVVPLSASGWRYTEQGGCTYDCNPTLYCNNSAYIAKGYDDSTWLPTSTPDRGWLCDACTRFYRYRFHMDEQPETATLSVAADNGIACWLNGTLIGADASCTEAAYFNDVWDVPASSFDVGDNVLACWVKESAGAELFDAQLHVDIPSVETETVCATAGFAELLDLRCPSGGVITDIDYATYGSTAGSCGSYAVNQCRAPLSQVVVEQACGGKTSCQVSATDATYAVYPWSCGTPWLRTLTVQAQCTVPATRCVPSCGAGGACPDGYACPAPEAAEPPATHQMYRFIAPCCGNHYFAPDPAPPLNYVPEGPAFFLFSEPGPDRVPLYQAYCGPCVDHLQTLSPTEGAPGYAGHAILGYCSPQQTSEAPRHLFRLYSPGANDHIVVAGVAAAKVVQAAGYAYEVQSCWVPVACEPGTVWDGFRDACVPAPPEPAPACTPLGEAQCQDATQAVIVDSCGAELGVAATCTGDESCVEGVCVACQPDCTQNSCGDDGCDGSCGTCPAGLVCGDGQCVAPLAQCGECSTTAPCALGFTCRSWDLGGTGGFCVPTCDGGACPAGFTCDAASGDCLPEITRSCADGLVAVNDGCGQALGVCEECAPGSHCADGYCVETCVPDCTDKVCGADGCAGSCGDCDAGQVCDAGQCTSPGSECDPCTTTDGCGEDLTCRSWPDYPEVTFCAGLCPTGDCAPDFQCTAGTCLPQITTICQGDEVWEKDACGNLLGILQLCAEDEHCEDGACVKTCVPDCEGKACGSDGCDAACGECLGTSVCVSHQCQEPAAVCEPCVADVACGDGLVCRGFPGYPQVTFCLPTCDGACPSGMACAGGVCTPTIETVCLGNAVWTKEQGCGNYLEKLEECGPDATCVAGQCKPGTGCDPHTCDSLVKECGAWPNGCGEELSCGDCPEGGTCANGLCKCVPKTCADLELGCGAAEDGCGGQLSCGACAGTEKCVDGQCQPVADCAGKECGDDGAGGSCGDCPTGEECNQGQCKEGPCEADCAGKDCGSDGCDGQCGTCKADEACTSGGTCECKPRSCTAQNIQCGAADDGCGATLQCGQCKPTETCEEGQCVCPLKTCEDLGFECGEGNDGCGGTLSCGACQEPDACHDNACVCQPKSCEDQGFACGPADDLCGGTVPCGECAANEACNEADHQCSCANEVCGETCCAEGEVCKQGACAAACVDLDQDGHALAEESCPSGDDHCDDDPHNWTQEACDGCVDNDNDGYGEACDKGEDCDDDDPERHEDCIDCKDLDGDGKNGIDEKTCPESETDPELGSDHCDLDEQPWHAHNWTADGCAECKDLDEDGYGDGCDKGDDCKPNDAGFPIDETDLPFPVPLFGSFICCDEDGDGRLGTSETPDEDCPMLVAEALSESNEMDFCDDNCAAWSFALCALCDDGDGDCYGEQVDCDHKPEECDGTYPCVDCDDADPFVHERSKCCARDYDGDGKTWFHEDFCPGEDLDHCDYMGYVSECKCYHPRWDAASGEYLIDDGDSGKLKALLQGAGGVGAQPCNACGAPLPPPLMTGSPPPWGPKTGAECTVSDPYTELFGPKGDDDPGLLGTDPAIGDGSFKLVNDVCVPIATRAAWSAEKCGTCVDNDADGFGAGDCDDEQLVDCDDNNAKFTNNCPEPWGPQWKITEAAPPTCFAAYLGSNVEIACKAGSSGPYHVVPTCTCGTVDLAEKEVCGLGGSPQCYDTPKSGIGCHQGPVLNGILKHYYPEQQDGCVNENPIALTASGAEVLDGVTQLVWEKTVICSAGPVCHDVDGQNEPKQVNYAVAQAYCAAVSDLTNKPWRLPDIYELHSLTEYEVSQGLYIDQTLFPMQGKNQKYVSYWSTTPVQGSPAGCGGAQPPGECQRWAMNYHSGTNVDDPESSAGHWVRCVRGGKGPAGPGGQRVYDTESQPGTVFDALTGLRWEQTVESNVQWAGTVATSSFPVTPSAAMHCREKMAPNGRVPNIKELFSIVKLYHEDVENPPFMAEDVFGVASQTFWSSTIKSVGNGGKFVVFGVDFKTGRIVGNLITTSKSAIRCVVGTGAAP